MPCSSMNPRTKSMEGCPPSSRTCFCLGVSTMSSPELIASARAMRSDQAYSCVASSVPSATRDTYVIKSDTFATHLDRLARVPAQASPESQAAAVPQQTCPATGQDARSHSSTASCCPSGPCSAAKQQLWHICAKQRHICHTIFSVRTTYKYVVCKALLESDHFAQIPSVLAVQASFQASFQCLLQKGTCLNALV